MKKNKITIIGLGLTRSTGGPVKTILYFKEALSANVIAFTSKNKLSKRDDLIDGISYIEANNNRIARFFLYASRAKRILAEQIVSNSDLLTCHILWRYSSHWTYKMSKKYNIPYWIVTHGSLDPYVIESKNSLIKKFWLVFFGKKFLKHASKILCSSQEEKEKLMTLYQGENIQVVNWPVELSIDMSLKEVYRNSICSKYKIDPNKKILLFLGRLHSIKQPVETINLFIKARVSDVVLVIAGPNEEYTDKELRTYLQKFQTNTNSIKILGPIYGNEKNQLILASDCLISLSKRENFGHVVAESLSVGNPVILSPGNYLTRDLRQVKCGWLLNSFDSDEVISAIREFSNLEISDLNLMGLNGKAWAERNLSKKIFEESINKLANDSIERHKKNVK